MSGPRKEKRITKRLSHQARIVLVLGINGEVSWFLVRLEYRTGDEWVEVVRSDHNPESERGHDVREEGVHIDVMRDGAKHRVEHVFPPTTPDIAVNVAEKHFRENHQRMTERFEQWHDE